MSRSRKPTDPIRFPVGAKVRVKSGVRDTDFPDIPLGGWSGTIEEVDTRSPVAFLIKWDRGMLDQMPSIYRKRCERDGLEIELLWLGEADLEPDDGSPVPIEQGIKTDVVSVSVVSNEDIAGYDPAQDRDPYQYYLAEERYYQA